MSRTTYYSTLTDGNKKKPRFLFNTVAKLTQNHNCMEPSILISPCDVDFMNCSQTVIVNVTDEIRYTLPSSDHQQIGLSEFNSLISSIKSATTLLDLIPTQL